MRPIVQTRGGHAIQMSQRQQQGKINSQSENVKPHQALQATHQYALPLPSQRKTFKRTS